MTKPEWKPVVGFERIYEVSNIGQVRSVKRGNLRTPPNSVGYPSVSLFTKGVRRERTVHRMVLEAFVGPCPEKHECLHKDGSRANNNLSNLRWGTHVDNMNEASRHGTLGGVAKTRLVVRQMKEMALNQSLRSIGRYFGVHHATVSRWINA